MTEPEASTSRSTSGVANRGSKELSALMKKVKAHPLFPSIEKLLLKIEAAMQLSDDESIFDIRDIIQGISEIRVPSSEEDVDLDKFMQDMLASQATQLRELQHVIGFIDKFISNYKHSLRKRVPVESLIGSVDSDDELPVSPASSSDEPVLNSFTAPVIDQEAPSLAMMHTPQGMISIPLRLPPSEAQQAAARRLIGGPPPMDETFRIRMLMIQTALNPNLTADNTRKVSNQLGCTPKQLESW
ncbi:psa-3 [Pristionchus pacificus]|nr:psa-3 [Pristionchus pacificus]